MLGLGGQLYDSRWFCQNAPALLEVPVRSLTVLFRGADIIAAESVAFNRLLRALIGNGATWILFQIA